MLGWEYPPQIAGGLGMACEGLTRALSGQDLDITFVVPQLYGQEQASHMKLVDSYTLPDTFESIVAERVERVYVPANLKPYWSNEEYLTSLRALESIQEYDLSVPVAARALNRPAGNVHYGWNLMEEVRFYADRVVHAFAEQEFDLIHAHDWMTFPAAVALAKLTGRPLIVHVHSLESDRSGFGSNQEIEAVERMGFNLASKIIAVSHYTKNKIKKFFGIQDDKISVVHNGIYGKRTKQHYISQKTDDQKIVLFLGRVTYQKGPEYFVRAAQKVISEYHNVKFVLAGSGDQLDSVKQLARDLGVNDYFNFPGFIRGEQIEASYNNADLYVMPSVSEPFGLTALEAASFSTPILISKQSGVSEVINNSLKFDYWDIDRLADLIVNALKHEELRQELVMMAGQELKSVRWDVAAKKTREIYHELGK